MNMHKKLNIVTKKMSYYFSCNIDRCEALQIRRGEKSFNRNKKKMQNNTLKSANRLTS